VSPTVQPIWLWQSWWETKRVGTGGRGVKLSARCSRNGWRRRGHPFWLFSLFHEKMDAPNGCSVEGPEWLLQCPDASQTGNGWPDGWPVGASLGSPSRSRTRQQEAAQQPCSQSHSLIISLVSQSPRSFALCFAFDRILTTPFNPLPCVTFHLNRSDFVYR